MAIVLKSGDCWKGTDGQVRRINTVSKATDLVLYTVKTKLSKAFKNAVIEENCTTDSGFFRKFYTAEQVTTF